jgi:hypothetical protein
MMRITGFWLVTGLVLALFWAGDGRAHERSESFSQWRYEAGLLNLTYTVSAREAARIPRRMATSGQGQTLARYLEGRIAVHDHHGGCRLAAGFQPASARSGYLRATATWHCQGPPSFVTIDSFFDLAAEHAHFATLEAQDVITRRLFTSEQRSWDIVSGASANQTGNAGFPDFLGLGLRHVLSGLDHLLFLLVLLTACRGVRELFWAVTGFTAGHSLTLGLAVIGTVEPNVTAIEATIGLTIALVAVERIAQFRDHALALALCCSVALLMLALGSRWLGGLQPELLVALALFTFCYLMLAPSLVGNGAFKVLVTSLFGLVHGLGFATGFLASNPEREQLLLPLLGFNLGLELAQLAVIGLLGAVILALKTRPRLTEWSADLAGSAACALGVYWFLERGFS